MIATSKSAHYKQQRRPVSAGRRQLVLDELLSVATRDRSKLERNNLRALLAQAVNPQHHFVAGLEEFARLAR